MINIQDQNKLFRDISRNISKRIEVYAIGGTAMMFLGLKKTTVDVDVVFSNKEDRKLFKDAITSLGYEDIDAKIVYGVRENTPLVAKIGEVRLDLFLFKIITSTFSDAMKARAKETHEFGNLIIKIADPNDILIMKSATAREKDNEDIVSLVNNDRIDWNVIIKEIEEQVNLGNEIAIMSLGEKLEKLNNKGIISVPKEVSDKIWKLFKKQVKEKAKKSK